MLEQNTATAPSYSIPDRSPAQTAREDMRAFSNAQAAWVNENTTVPRTVHAVNEANKDELDAITDKTEREKRLIQLYIAALKASNAERAQLYAQYKRENADAYKVYSRARTLIQRQRIWDKKSDRALQQFEESLTATSEWVTSQRAQIEWLRACKPTEEEFGSPGGRGSALNSMQQMIEGVADRAEKSVDANDAEVMFAEAGVFADVIDTVETDFDLTPVYEDVDDGFLWFVDEDTDKLYYFSKISLTFGSTVTSSYSKNAWVGDRWRSREHTDLVMSMSVSGLGKTGVEQSARVSGLWNRIRPWIKRSVDGGNTVPSGFPEEMVNSDI